MGRVKNPMATGKVGNLVFYEYRGKQCCRTAPGTIKQSAGMKKNSRRFGLAAKASCYLRETMGPAFHDAKDKAMLYGFNSAINKWLREYQINEHTSSVNNFYIDNFQFNEAAPLPMLVKKPVKALFTKEGAISIDVPELIPGTDIIAPAGTVQVHYNAWVTGCELCFKTNDCFLVNHERSDKRNAHIVLEYGERPLPPQSLSLQMQLMKSALVVVAFSIQYEVKMGDALEMVTDRNWWPVSVAGSCFGSR